MSDSLYWMGRLAFAIGAVIGIFMGFLFEHYDLWFWVPGAAGLAVGFAVPQFVIGPIARRIARRHEQVTS